MPMSLRPPRICTGGVPPFVDTSAPMARSGFATRSIGRFMREASPMRCESNACAASSPVNRRIAVPALPMSSGPFAAPRPRRPQPRISTVSGLRCSTATPSARIARMLARQSSLGRNPLISLAPSAMPASITERCEIDLSPGTVSSPAMPLTGWHS